MNSALSYRKKMSKVNYNFFIPRNQFCDITGLPLKINRDFVASLV